MTYRGCFTGVVLNVPALSGDVVLRRVRVLARLPHPHELRIVTAAAVLVHLKLVTRAQAGAVLVASITGLKPRRVVQASSHAL